MSSAKSTWEELFRLFFRNGCIRYPKPERLKEGHAVYKKGYEIRWTALNNDEHSRILQLLKKVGFNHGKPFKKNNRIIIPVYGYDKLAEFQKMSKAFSAHTKKIKKI
jgi:hypothetical protein